MKPYSVPFPTRLARGIMRPIFRLVFHALSEVKIEGRENIPRHGAYIVAINHISLFEPPFVLAFWPTAPEAIGAVEIWSKPGQALLARLYGGIQVHRGEFDRHLMDTTLAVLSSGKPMVLAPEGGRSHSTGMRRALPGVAYIADKAGVPVVPVGIIGTVEDFFTQAIHLKRPRLTMRIGKPIQLPPVEGKGADRREALRLNTDQIMQAIAALVPSEYRGVYHSSDEVG